MWVYAYVVKLQYKLKKNIQRKSVEITDKKFFQLLKVSMNNSLKSGI